MPASKKFSMPGRYKPREDHYRQNRWDDGDAALQDAVRRFPLKVWSKRIDVGSLIQAILDATRESEIWALRAKRLVEIFSVKGGLARLGEGLVQSLAFVTEAKLNGEGLAAWRRAWVEAGREKEELRLPLRLFEVGMSYHESGDPEELLTLVSAERSFVAEALGLDQRMIKTRKKKTK